MEVLQNAREESSHFFDLPLRAKKQCAEPCLEWGGLVGALFIRSDLAREVEQPYSASHMYHYMVLVLVSQPLLVASRCKSVELRVGFRCVFRSLRSVAPDPVAPNGPRSTAWNETAPCHGREGTGTI